MISIDETAILVIDVMINKLIIKYHDKQNWSNKCPKNNKKWQI